MAEVQDVVSGLPEGKQEQALEAVLFAAGEPVELEVLARAFGMPTKQMQELLDNMRFSYNQQNRGIQMLRLGNAYQLCTRQEYAACVHAVFDKKREVSLSAAALEVLAIAAYNQPVTRAFLEQVRGVDSSGVVASLLDKGLLEERGRLDVPGASHAVWDNGPLFEMFWPVLAGGFAAGGRKWRPHRPASTGRAAGAALKKAPCGEKQAEKKNGRGASGEH